MLAECIFDECMRRNAVLGTSKCNFWLMYAAKRCFCTFTCHFWRMYQAKCCFCHFLTFWPFKKWLPFDMRPHFWRLYRSCVSNNHTPPRRRASKWACRWSFGLGLFAVVEDVSGETPIWPSQLADGLIPLRFCSAMWWYWFWNPSKSNRRIFLWSMVLCGRSLRLKLVWNLYYVLKNLLVYVMELTKRITAFNSNQHCWTNILKTIFFFKLIYCVIK